MPTYLLILRVWRLAFSRHVGLLSILTDFNSVTESFTSFASLLLLPVHVMFSEMKPTMMALEKLFYNSSSNNNGDNERKERKIVCVDAVHWATTKITTHDDAQDHPRSAQRVRLWSMTSATSAATEALNAPYASEGQLSFRIDLLSLFGFDFGYPLHIAHDLWPIIIASTQCRFLCRPALCLYKKAGFAIRAEQRTFLLSTLKPRSFAS